MEVLEIPLLEGQEVRQVAPLEILLIPEETALQELQRLILQQPPMVEAAEDQQELTETVVTEQDQPEAALAQTGVMEETEELEVADQIREYYLEEEEVEVEVNQYPPPVRQGQTEEYYYNGQTLLLIHHRRQLM